MSYPVRLIAITSHERHAVVAALTAALNDVGWILDFKQFSNLALSVQFEISPARISRMRAAFASVPLHLAARSQEAIEALEATPVPELPDPIPASIQVTFLHEEPDLRIPVPAVPG